MKLWQRFKGSSIDAWKTIEHYLIAGNGLLGSTRQGIANRVPFTGVPWSKPSSKYCAVIEGKLRITKGKTESKNEQLFNMSNKTVNM